VALSIDLGSGEEGAASASDLLARFCWTRHRKDIRGRQSSYGNPLREMPD